MTEILSPERPPQIALFGFDERAVARRLRGDQVLRGTDERLQGLSSAGRTALAGELARALTAVAAIDLIDVLAAGWRTHRALRSAARRTADAAGTQELVDLAAHRITSVHKPAIDVLLDGVRLGSVDCELRLELVVKGLVAVVAGGRLQAVRSGRCTAEGRLSAEGIELVRREVALDLPMLDRFPGGLPLLPPDAAG